MVNSFSGSFETSPVSGIGVNWPKKALISYTGIFDETIFKWKVSWSAVATGGTRASAWTESYYGSVVFSVNGVEVNSNSYNSTIKAYQDSILLSGNFEVAPSSDGSLSITASASFRFYYNSASGDSTASETIICPNADIGSKAALSQNSITITGSTTSNALTATITVKGEGTLWHMFKIGTDYSSAVQIPNVDRIADTANVTIPYSLVLNNFPYASGTIYFYLDTYKDSAHTIKYGPTNITPLSVTVTAADFLPSISGTSAIIPSDDTNPFHSLQSDPELLIAGITDSLFKIFNGSCVPGQGATLSRVEYSIAYGSISTVSGEFPADQLQTFLFGVCPASGVDYQAVYTIKIYDSRNAVLTRTITKTVYGYDTPKIQASIYRTEDNTSTEKNDSGEYVYVSFSATQNCTVNGNNTLHSCYCTAEGAITGLVDSNPSPTTENPNLELTKNESAVFTITAIDKIGKWFQDNQTKEINAKYVVPVNRAIFPLILHDDLHGNIGVEINGFAKHINPSGTPTMYHFEMGSEEMDIGIHSDGKKGFTDGTNWLQYHDGTAHHLFGLYGTNNQDSKTISSLDVQYRDCLVSGNGIVIATVSLWKQVYSNVGDLIALIDYLPDQGSAIELSRTHFLSGSDNDHCASATAACYATDGDKIRLVVQGTMAGDKIAITNILSIGCELTIDGSFHSI